jgi:type II secretory pathway pseudopilin PulG
MATSIRRSTAAGEGGFTLIELVLSVGILMVISGLMMRGTLDLSQANARQSNNSEMHAGIRNATALLQQEVGQAGRVALPAPVTLTNAVTGVGSQWAQVNSVASMFVGERLVIVRGDKEDIVAVTAIDTANNRFQAGFPSPPYDAGSRVMPTGGIPEGVVPTTMANGSTPNVLKIVGDINDDGSLVYVEYTCDWNAGRMFRNMMPFDAGAKPALTVEQVLLDNLLPNPPDPDGTPRPCFTYEQRTFNGRTFVINVAIMTTVRTDRVDPTTGQFQTVTKALLNVAPRNVFHVWQIASLNYQNRIQPLPPSVVDLLD